MPSVVSGGTADRIVARTLFSVPRAGSGTDARYSSIVFGAALPFAAGPRSRGFVFFIGFTAERRSVRVRPSAYHPASA